MGRAAPPPLSSPQGGGGGGCRWGRGGYGSAFFGVPLSFFFLRLHSWLEALIVTAPAPPPVPSDEDRCEERELSWRLIAGVTTTRMQVHRENEPPCVIASASDEAIQGPLA